MSTPPTTTWYNLAPLLEPSRRLVLKGAVAGGALLGRTSSAEAQEARAALAAYKRTFFTDAEWAFILAACARLIPSDGDGPGAIETRVPIFIDLQMGGDFGKGADWYMQGPHVANADPTLGFQSPLPPAEIYRGGIKSVDNWCRTEKSKAFAELDAAGQDDVLRALAGGKIPLAPELRDFFSLLLQNTKEGFFADPMYGGNYKMAGWSHIGFPGARGSFLEWVDKHNVRYPLGPVSINGERG